jgi:hypothetical protein
MPTRLDPRLEILPPAQHAIWKDLAPATELSFVLYGGTAVALHLGHRQSVDFDFFTDKSLDKSAVRRAFRSFDDVAIVQDEAETLAVLATSPSGAVRISFFGGLAIGRVNDPLRTSDGVLLVASPDDLLATKLKAILDRAEAKDYRDIAALLKAGTPLPRALSAFRQMFGGEPATVLRALGYFEDGDLPSLADADRHILRRARDDVRDLPEVTIARGLLAGNR